MKITKKMLVLYTGFIMAFILLSNTITAVASGYLYRSTEVSFDKKNMNMSSTNVQGAIEELYESANDYSTLRNMIYPVGSIYISVTDDTVAKVKERFGGEWEVFGSGRTLVGVDTSDSNFDTVAKEVGSNSQSYTPAGTNAGTAITVDQMPSHNHSYVKATGVGNHTLTAAEMPYHGHNIALWGTAGNLGTWKAWSNNGATFSAYSGGGLRGNYGNASVTWVSGSQTVSQNGSGDEAGVTRGSGGGGAHNHPLNTSTVDSGSKGGGKTHTHTFTGTAATISHIQKSITVYMYKRVS